MSRQKYLTGLCSHCGLQIDYPAEMVGTHVTCPHCGQVTMLSLAAPEQEPVVPRRIIVWSIVALLILLAGLAGALYALKRARHLAERRHPAEQQAK